MTKETDADPRAKLLAAAEAAAKSMADRKARAADRELEHLVKYNELVAKFAASHGEENQGRTWQVVDCGPEGFLVVKRLIPTIVSTWEKKVLEAGKKGEAPSTNDMVPLVLQGLLYPDEAGFRKMVHGDGATPGAEGVANLAMFTIRRLHAHFEGELTAGK